MSLFTPPSPLTLSKLAQLFSSAPAAGTLAGTEPVFLLQNGAFVQATAAQVAALAAAPAVTNGVLVALGDSIFAGTHTSGYDVPTQLGFPSGVTVNNGYSTDGHSLGQIAGDVPAGLFSLYDPTKACVVVIERGTNDFGNDQRSASDTYAILTNLVKAYQSQGFYVAVCTVLPRASGSYGWTANSETQRQAYNPMVVSNSAGADIVIDQAADPQIGAASYPTNTALCSDGTHPTNAGVDIQTGIFKPKIATLLVKAPRVQPGYSGSVLRFRSLSGTLVETIDGGSFDYASSATDGAYNTAHGSDSRGLAAGADGWIEMTMATPASPGLFFGFSTSGSPGGYGDLSYGTWADTYNGPNYGWWGGGHAQTSTSMAVGDKVRVERVGTTINLRVNGAVAYSWTGASAGRLTPYINSGGPAGKAIQPACSANLA